MTIGASLTLHIISYVSLAIVKQIAYLYHKLHVAATRLVNIARVWRQSVLRSLNELSNESLFKIYANQSQIHKLITE